MNDIEKRAHDLAIMYTDYVLSNDSNNEGTVVDELLAASTYKNAYNEFLSNLKID